MNDNTSGKFDPHQDSRQAEIISRLADAAEEAENKDPVADAAEAAMTRRILDNLGLSKSTVPEELHDNALADVVSTWADSTAVASSTRGGTRTFSITNTTIGLFDDNPGELSASIEVTSPELDTSRIRLTVGIPSAPAVDVLTEMVVRGWSTPLSFPLQLVNRGSEDFALYELSGAATVIAQDLPAASHITEVRLRPAHRPFESAE